MKRAFIIIFVCFFVSSLCAENFLGSETQRAFMDTWTSTEKYTYSLVTLPVEYLILFNHQQWVEKRYTDKRMIEEIQEIIQEYMFSAVMILKFTAESDYKFKLEIPDDLTEFIFLEDQTGSFVRCMSAEASASSLNFVSDQVVVQMVFADKTDDGRILLEGAESITIVIGGLDLPQNEFGFDWPVPYFQDLPEDVAALYEKARDAIEQAQKD